MSRGDLVAERDFVTERPPARSPRPPSGRDPRPRAPVDRRPAPPGRSGSGAPRPPEPTIDSQAAFKGVLIVLVTVVVGGFVFVQGLHRPADDPATSVPPAAGVNPSPASTASAVSPAGVPETTAASRPPGTKVAPAELAIVVGNAVDPDKPVASTVATKLNKAGYTGTIRKMNVPKAAERTVVHYRAPEWREDALAVARALDIPEIDVTALPNPPPLDASERNVFVIVGRQPKALGQP
jgi:hypothetical protein